MDFKTFYESSLNELEGTGEPVNTEAPKVQKITVSGNKLKGYVISMTENGFEKQRLTPQTLEDVKTILSHVKDIPIIYKISNEEEQVLTGKTTEPPKEEPLKFGADTSNLLNNRTEYNTTHIPLDIKSKIVKQTITDVRNKLNNKNAMIKEIKSLKNSQIVDPISKEYMNNHVFLDNLDDTSNLIRYVNYLIYVELDKHIVNDLLQNKSASRIKRFGGNNVPTVKDLAKEITPLFNRILNKKDKSELFNAFGMTK